MSMSFWNCISSFSNHQKAPGSIFDPPSNGRIGGHYFHVGCPSVRQSVTQTKSRYNVNLGAWKTKQRTPCMKIMTTYWPGGSL